jgi:NAD(P)-dependent dehydrogenase (short-subunit alcohol dehydrogenase family)
MESGYGPEVPLRRALSDSVVVLTGASSGIGAATAEALAARGAAVVLAARRVGALHRVAGRCGGRTLVVPTDVSDPGAVEALARAAETRFGRIDAWINNASVGVYAPLADAPVDDVRRAIEVNLLGYLYGVQAALPRLRADGGVIVNVASVLAATTVPWMGAYNMSKHAVRALSDTLRQELTDGSVSVCTVLPASIDTPFYRHAANRTGRAVQPIPPVYPAGVVARTIVSVLRRPRREAYAGRLGHVLAVQQRLLPGATEWVMARYARRVALGSAPAPPTDGNLFVAGTDPAAIDGGFHGRRRALVRAVVAAGFGVGLAGAVAARRRMTG